MPDPARCKTTLLPMIEVLKRTLWATTEKLRGSMDAADSRHLVLGLNFVRHISDSFQAQSTELTARLADPAEESHRSQSG